MEELLKCRLFSPPSVSEVNVCFSSNAVNVGYPAGTMPLGYLEPSGRPFGLCVLARANEESKIISIMSAWESVNFPQRRLPKPLLDAESSRVSLQ